MTAQAEPKEGRVAIFSSADLLKNSVVLAPEAQFNIKFFADFLELFTMDRRLIDLDSEAEERERSRIFEDLLESAGGPFRLSCHLSRELPAFLGDLRSRILAALEKLKSISAARITWEVEDPEEKAREVARERAREYLGATEEGRIPREPRTLDDQLIVYGKGKTEAEILAERQKEAKKRALGTGQPLEQCFRERLEEEFREVFRADLARSGIYPTTFEAGGVKGDFYSAIEVSAPGVKEKECDYLHSSERLDFKVARLILKVARGKLRVLFFDGGKNGRRARSEPEQDPEPSHPDGHDIIPALGEIYAMEEVALDGRKTLESAVQDPAGIGEAARAACFLVLRPHRLDERQVREIAKAISGGLPTIFCISRWSIDLSWEGRNDGLPLWSLNPGLDELFSTWGVSLGAEILASRTCSSLSDLQSAGGMPYGPSPAPLPVLLKTDANSLRNALPVVFPAAAGLTIDENRTRELGLKVIELASTGWDDYCPVPVPANGSSDHEPVARALEIPELCDREAVKIGEIASRPLAVLLEGKFPPPGSRDRPR